MIHLIESIMTTTKANTMRSYYQPRVCGPVIYFDNSIHNSFVKFCVQNFNGNLEDTEI
jgi:hypothetical protein